MATAKEIKHAMLSMRVSDKTVDKFLAQMRNFDDKAYCEISLLGIGNKGHAGLKHIGMSNAELQARAQNRVHKISVEHPFCASSFPNVDITEIAALIRRVLLLKQSAISISALLLGEVDQAVLQVKFPEPVGYGAFTGASYRHCYPLHGVCVVVRRGDYEPIYIHTAYPIPTKADEVKPKEDILWHIEDKRHRREERMAKASESQVPEASAAE